MTMRLLNITFDLGSSAYLGITLELGTSVWLTTMSYRTARTLYV